MQPETLVYKRVQDCDLYADVYRPARMQLGAPVIVWFHGGALIFGSRTRLNTTLLLRYLDAGYTVVAVDYRLAPETKLSEIIEDIQDAVRWVQEEGPTRFSIDPDQLAVMGESAGGYLTLMSGFRVVPPPRALVVFYGYGDITGDWYGKPSAFYNRQPAVSREAAEASIGSTVIADTQDHTRAAFYLHCRQQGIWAREVTGHDPATEPDYFDAFCPLRNVAADYPPTILLHGDADDDVPYEQSVLMQQALTTAGIEHEFVTLPGAGHGFDWQTDDPQVQRAFERVLAFLDRHLRLPS
jgi:acetyl esterase/lipase